MEVGTVLATDADWHFAAPETTLKQKPPATTKDLPEQFRRRLSNAKLLPLDQRYPLLSVLISMNWNISKAAQKLRWSRMTIYRKMAKYHIHRT